MDDARKETIHFDSAEGRTQIHGVIWWPEQEPRGVVQIVHGMAEHIMRYEPFALYLNERGFVVCGHDHLGHGRSVLSKERLGRLPLRGGSDVLVNDVDHMRRLMLERLDSPLPYFLFGHSMGSFVTRAYISRNIYRNADNLAGAIICGTGHIAYPVSAVGNLLAQAIARVRGEDRVSKLLENISVGAYSKAIDHARTPLDWLSHVRKNVDEYIADELCGFSFSAGGNASLTALTREVCTKACCKRVPHDLPLLYIAGADDPVGNNGKGVRIAARMAYEAGVEDVTCRIYEGMRHEILNEEHGERVMADVVLWMERHL
jgi:alpha-beta hydrolase superfamily lysophospholipase